MRALAAVTRSLGGEFSIEQIELDRLRDDEVLVRMAGTGICHTDIVWRDYVPGYPRPCILGHEGAGVVERVGAAVSGLAEGDHVVLSFRSCGSCTNCSIGQPAYCESFGGLNISGHRCDGSDTARAGDGAPLSASFFGQSSFASYAIAYPRNVVKVAADLPLELLGPLGCGVQTGAGAAMRSLACRRGSSLLVTGGGTVGLSAVLGAVVQGCSTIIVSDPLQRRRDLALEIGATHAIDPATGSLTKLVRSIVPGGVDYAIDTTGHLPILNETLGLLRAKGALGMVGMPAPGSSLDLSLELVGGLGISVQGIVEGDSDPQTFIPELLALWKAGRFPFDRLIETFEFSHINDAIAAQAAGDCVKPVLIFEKENAA